MILLTSEDFVKSMTNISDNLQGSYLGPAIREAQDVDYQAIVGTSLYKKLQELVEEDTINDEANGKYKELLDNSQYFIAYSAIVKIILLASVKLDNFGASQATDDNIKALSLEEVLKLQNIYQSKADFYAKRLQKYLCENEDFFPELGNSGDVKPNLYSAASTGLFLGGQRGRKMPKANGCGSCGTSPAGGGTYTLPVASETTLGGIKVGSGLSIDSSGRLSADGGSEETYHLDEMTDDELKDLYNYLSGKSESEISEIAFYYGGTRLTLDTKESSYIYLTGIGSKLNGYLANERLYRVSLSSSGISTTKFECAPQITIYCDYTSENKTLSIADSPINFAAFGAAMSRGHRVNFNIILLSGSTPSYSGGSQTNLMSSCISCIYRPITQMQGYYYADFNVSGVIYEARWKMVTGRQTLLYWREKTYYTLPTASSETLGGVKIGSGISIDSGGTLSAEGGVAQYDLDAMTQSERAEFVAMCENLTDGERRLLFVYRDGVICRYDHTEGSGDSFKIGFYSYREDGWDYPTTRFRHFFITADGSYQELGNGVYPNILTFDTTYSDTAHTLSNSDNLSPLIPVSNLGPGDAKVALNLRLLVGNNQTVLSSNAWSERTGSWEGKIGAEWHYSGNVITAVWNVVEHNATIASWTEVPEGGSSGGGRTVIDFDSMTQQEKADLFATISALTSNGEAVNDKYVFIKSFYSQHSGNQSPLPMEYTKYESDKMWFLGFNWGGQNGEIWRLRYSISSDGSEEAGMDPNYSFPGLDRAELISYRDYLKYDFTTGTFTTNNNNDILYTGDVRSFLWVIDPKENAFEGNKVPEYKFRVTDETYTDREFSNPVLSIETLATPVSLPDSNGSYRDMDKIYYFDYGYCTVSMYVDSGGHSYARLKCVKNIPKWINISQADYDALVQAGTVDPNTYYVII